MTLPMGTGSPKGTDLGRRGQCEDPGCGLQLLEVWDQAGVCGMRGDTPPRTAGCAVTLRSVSVGCRVTHRPRFAGWASEGESVGSKSKYVLNIEARVRLR